MNFVEELTWRGMVHTMMPGTEELLEKEMVTGYLGIDPTADSLHIGHLCGVMILKHFQRCGHKPLALVGGATGMIGDPSGKSQERNLLDEETLRHNQECIKKQLSKFLDFESDAPNRAELVNNYDWMKDFTFLDFARTYHGELYDGKRFRTEASQRGSEGWIVVYRVHLPTFAGLRLFAPIRDKRLQVANGRFGPMGKYHDGRRVDSSHERRRGVRTHLSAYH